MSDTGRQSMTDKAASSVKVWTNFLNSKIIFDTFLARLSEVDDRASYRQGQRNV